MFMGVRRSLLIYFVVYGCLWISECLWVFMGVYRCLRESMGVHGFSGIWDFSGCLWVSRCLSVYMGVMGVDQCLWVYF